MSFPRYPKYKDSCIEWLGELPEHWEVARLGSLASKIGSGKTPYGGGESYADEGVMFIRSQNVYDEGLFLDDVVFVKEKRQGVISRAVTEGLNPEAPMKSSGTARLGDVPAHWTVSKVKRLWEAAQNELPNYTAVFHNRLNEQDSQFMLVLSACRVDDPEEEAKIRAVSAGLDRMFSLLQLQGAYDSNEFAARLYDVSTDIRDQPAEKIPPAFEKHLLAELVERRGAHLTLA